LVAASILSHTVHVSEQPTVSVDVAESWREAIRRAEGGETVTVVAGGKRVADVVPSGALDRLRETVDVLSDNDLVQGAGEGLADLRAGRVSSAEDVEADLRARDAGR
jgi:antitoxin (DNA-binding transcriptional repressor) of toxin-antitoxin stability system